MQAIHIFRRRDCDQTSKTDGIDLVVACNVMNRVKYPYTEVVGRVSDDVMIRVHLAPTTTVRQAVSKVREAMTEAMVHQGYPMRALVEDLNFAADGRPPCQTWFLMLPLAMFSGTLAVLLPEQQRPLRVAPDLYLEQTDLVPREATCWFDLDLTFAEGHDSIQASMAYSTEVYTEGTVQRYVDDLVNVMQYVCTHPDVCISEILAASE